MEQKKNPIKVLFQKPEMGTILPLAILMIAVAIVNTNFFNISNILDILRTASFSFIVAVPKMCIRDSIRTGAVLTHLQAPQACP